MYQYII